MIAICSATKEAYIAIEIDGKQEFCNLDSSCKHSENILVKIDEMLTKMDKNINDNNSYAVVVGPGSFTGLRIGVALVKGFCAVKEKKVIKLSTLKFIAYTYIKKYSPKSNFVCALNALSGLYFVCEFDINGNGGEERLIDKEEYSKITKPIVSIEEEDISQIKVALSANELLELAKNEAKKCEFVDYHKLMPVYLRKSQAEANLEEKKLKKS